ncbi:MAG: hypothetical protein IKO83_04240 [Oscillospiraceae bacterium]|nr:hypothetical protein [Oscillospiraceae bacterium]
MAAFTIRSAEHLSHAYILSSPDRAACLELAEQIAAAAVCERGTDAPCGKCRGCRKARDGVHPDIIHIRREEGRQFVSVDQIRAMTADAYVLPNEAARKVYILDEADRMKTPEAQNAALKTLEEPPAGVIFLLCAENAGVLLPTVRSRCVELSTNSERAGETDAGKKLAIEYLDLTAKGDRAGLCAWCLKNDRMEKTDTAAFLESVQTLLAELLTGRREEPRLERVRLWALQALIERCNTYLQGNVGSRQLFGLLAVDSIAEGGNRG